MRVILNNVTSLIMAVTSSKLNFIIEIFSQSFSLRRNSWRN